MNVKEPFQMCSVTSGSNTFVLMDHPCCHGGGSFSNLTMLVQVHLQITCLYSGLSSCVRCLRCAKWNDHANLKSPRHSRCNIVQYNSVVTQCDVLVAGGHPANDLCYLIHRVNHYVLLFLRHNANAWLTSPHIHIQCAVSGCVWCVSGRKKEKSLSRV